MNAPAALDPDEHTCHAKACKTEVEPARFMCLRHWRMVPAPMRQAIEALYRPDQEVDKQPSDEYLAIARAAIAAVAHKESRQPPVVTPVERTAAPAVRTPSPVAERVEAKQATKSAKPVQLVLF